MLNTLRTTTHFKKKKKNSLHIAKNPITKNKEQITTNYKYINIYIYEKIIYHSVSLKHIISEEMWGPCPTATRTNGCQTDRSEYFIGIRRNTNKIFRNGIDRSI